MRAGERLCIISIIFMALLASASFPHFLSASTESELTAAIEAKNKEIAQLEEEIKQYQKSVNQTAATARTLQGAVNRINQEIKNLNYQLSLTKTKISKTELEIKNLAAELQKTLDAINKQRTLLTEALRQLDELERQTLVEVFLKYPSLAQFFDIIEKNKTLERAIKQSYDTLRLLQGNLEAQKNVAESARRELLGLTEQLADQRALEEEERKTKATLLHTTKNQEAQYQKLLKERETEREAILQEIQEIEDNLRKLIDPARLPRPRAGVLVWPIIGAVLTQSFGATPDSPILYNGQPHNGIDIRAPIGTPVYAAESGEVVRVGNTDAFPKCLSYGKWILIRHPNNLATLYAHLSLIKVQDGAMMKRGELIGYSGDTGYATGPHLHFTVYDARTVEFRASNRPKSTCKTLPFGGYLNPLAYL